MSIEQISRPTPVPTGIPEQRRVSRPAGRAAELAVLARLVADPDACGAVVVEGEAGMGTSTLLAAVRDDAARHGWAVLAGCAAGPGGGAPLSPFYDAFGPTPLLDLLRPSECWLGRAADSPSRRQELYRRIRAGLAAAGAGRRGLLISLDDLHWADPASVDLLVALLRHPPAAPLLVVLGARTGRLPAPLERALGAATRVAVAPLDDDAVRQLLPTATSRHRRALLAASLGNPRHLRALAGLPTAVLSGLPHGPGIPGDDGGRVDATVTAELRALPPLAHVVVGTAALLGEHIDPEAVAVVSGTDPDAVTGVLDELVALDVLRDVEGHIRFRHPLVRAAACRMTRPAWRVAAHRRIDGRLAELDAPALARAPHVDASARLGDAAAADLLTAAAREVLAEHPGTAARWLGTAERIRPDGGGRLLLLARALLLAGEPEAAARTAGRAAGPDRTAAVLLVARVHEARGAFREAQAVLRADLGADGAGRPALQVELDALDVAQGIPAPALRAARLGPGTAADGAAATAAAAAVVAAASAVLTGPGGREQPLVAAAARAVDGLADTELGAVLHHLPLLVAAEHDTAPADALRHAERGLAVAARLGYREEIPALRLAAATVTLDHGRLGTAARLAEDAFDEARDLDQDVAAATATALRAVAAAWRDGPAAALRLLADGAGPGGRVWSGSGWPAAAAAAAAEVLLVAGRPADAALVCRAALPAGGRPAGPVARPRLWALAARAALDGGDLDGAGDLADRALRALRGERTGTACAQVHGVLARVALARRDVARAVAAARAAVDALHGTGGVAAARAGLVLADTVAATGDAAGADRRTALAVEELEAAGAPWLAHRAAEDARRRQQPEPTPYDGLSRREREIALLVSEGLTNRAIAGRLTLSVRTVDSHVARILAKLGVSSRLGVVRALDHAGPARPAENVGGHHA